MAFRIRVGVIDSAGDLPVMLEERLWILPIWVRTQRTWVLGATKKGVPQLEQEIEQAKERMRVVARALTNPKIAPHSEVLDV